MINLVLHNISLVHILVRKAFPDTIRGDQDRSVDAHILRIRHRNHDLLMEDDPDTAKGIKIVVWTNDLWLLDLVTSE